jgi:AAA+ superfamily predicted ATPase
MNRTPTWQTGEIFTALKLLDRRLEAAVAAAQQNYGSNDNDLFRGLYISPEDVQRLLARHPGEAGLYPTGNGRGKHLAPALTPGSPLAWLSQHCQLTPFDLDTLIIGLAPEVDLRYERLYAYLQDDVSRKRPSVDLVLNLLCTTAAEKMEMRRRLSPGGPLVDHHLVLLEADPTDAPGAALAHTLRLDEQIICLLLDQPGPDSRLASAAMLKPPAPALAEAALTDSKLRAALELAFQANAARSSLIFYFQGTAGTGRRLTAEILASKLGLGMCSVNWESALASGLHPGHLAELVSREAQIRGAILYIDHLDAGQAGLAAMLARHSGVTILAGTEYWQGDSAQPLEVLTVPFPLPEYPQRRSAWQATTNAAGFALEEIDLEALASRFRLSYDQIAGAVIQARAAARLRRAGDPSSLAAPAREELFAAARAQTGHTLNSLAHKIEPAYTWDDIVLPEDSRAQLMEICERVMYGEQVLGAWGFGEKLSLGKGVNALFAGPSGTGKTMAAEIIASALGLDLYKIDLSGVVSKYIGETEKNLERIFAAAENANAILFFDEADALFGRRSEVRDAHDRYANIEIAYLLQQMERYDGLTILATNLRQNLDEAFLRRLAFTVHFPFPDEMSRRQIWAGIWPPETSLASLDLDYLAAQFKLSGGNIKNIALAAAFRAAAAGEAVGMQHVLHGIRREYQKLGKPLSPADLGRYAQDGGAA